MAAIRKKGFGLTSQIFVALLLGIAFGFIFPKYAVHLKVFGDIFLRMIRMIVVPLIFSALVVGIAGTGDFKQLGRLSLKTFIWFEVATTFALVLGLVAANVFKPGSGVSITNLADVSAISAAAHKPVDLMQILIDIVPVNIIDAMSRESLLQIIFFSGFFGVATAAAMTLLYGAQMPEMLKQLRQQFDTILIDTPPMLQIPDARVLGRLSDRVILVIRAGRTTRDAAQAAFQRFQEDGTNVLGTILNDWNPKHAPSGYYGYYNGYYKGYKNYYSKSET